MSEVVSVRAEGDTPVKESPESAGTPRTLPGLRLAASAIGVYLMLRALSLEVMYVLASYAHARAPGRQVYPDGSIGNQWRSFTSIMDALVSWDGRWYVKIAGGGLGGPVGAVDADGVPYELRLAFFPLYPWLARPLTFLPFVSPVAACLIVSFLSAVAAAWGLYAVGRHVGGHRVGVMLAAVWAIAPAAMTQNGAYTESLFTALAAWALYAVLTERWLLAGALAAVSGLSRPTAAALIGTVGLAALVAAISRRGGWRPYAAMLLAPAGLLAYFAFAAARLGGFSRYTDLHHNTFGARWDNGENTWGMVSDILFGVDDDNAAKPIRVLSLVMLAAFVVLLVLLVPRVPWQLTVFAAAMLVLATGTSTHISMIGRHLMPAFPVLLIPAMLLARAATRDRIIVLGLLALLSGWYAGWLPFISGQAI
ncbi:glycosyltransferase family 39 protein [Actinoplanes oblitus]|uniref:Glycosyltransferase family 39 protein n=1 Tax=Actinoplanes oblitus TaxID=3040509 RepID=A0ABY8WR80_9ACTN|nr:glycosyltransferase family 39 protein [Actinoplanes oblitus]WIM99588.1 glycosyltransferase family 39 protein [Actinoplanes oblitus]